MILVVGATGFLGGDICRRLATTGRPVRALVRPTADPSALAQLRELGVETAEGDLRDPASLARACRGVAAVVSTATSMRSRQPGDSIEATDHQGQLDLVDAARAAGVGRFVYISYSGQIGEDDPLTTAKRAVEQRLRESGMDYTVLRPSFFMEAWLSPALGFDFPNARATVYGAGTNGISWVSLSDVAAFAVRALEEPGPARATIELGGPEALSPLEIVGIFEELGGRRFEIQHVPEEALLAQAETTDSLQRTFAALMLACAKGDPISMDELLEHHPVRLTRVRDYAERALMARSPSAFAARGEHAVDRTA